MARPRPEPGAASSARTPRCSTVAAQRRRHARAVVVDRDVHDAVVGCGRRHVARSTGPTCRRCRAGCRASRRGPRAARARRRRRRRPTRDARARDRRGVRRACAPAPPRPARPRARRAGRGARRRRPRVRQVVVDLPAHPVHLLAQQLRPAAAAPPRPLGLVGDHRQRRLQAVGQVAGPRQRPAHRLFAVVEQRVEVVDERLHLARERRRRRASRSPACTSDNPARSRASAASARRIWRPRRPGTPGRPPRRRRGTLREQAGGTSRGKLGKRNSASVATMPATTNSPTVHSTAPISSVAAQRRGALTRGPRRGSRGRAPSRWSPAPSLRRSRAMKTSTVLESRSSSRS